MNYASLSSIGIIILFTHLPGVKDIMRTEYLDLQSYLLVAGMSVLPFILHEIFKILIFEANNLSVYELYKYEYEAHKEDEILKIIETEAEAAVEPNGESNGGANNAWKGLSWLFRTWV